MAFKMWAVMLTSAGISLVLCVLLIPLARRISLLDHPSDRKVHISPTPLVGGLAVYFALVIVTWQMAPYSPEALPFLAACALILITGMLDDLHELSPITRFMVQIVCCLIMIFASKVVLTDFGSLMWDGVFSLGFLSVPVTIFAALGVINAFNMMDGIDGLAAMIFVIAGAAMAWLAFSAGFNFNAGLLLTAVAAVLGFFVLNARFPWNKKARVFLGNSGSAFLGLFLAWQFIDLGNGDDRVFAPMTAVWLLGVPLVDTIRLMFHRWKRGGSSLAADQYHLHHAFLKAGFSVNQTVIGIGILVLFTTAVGIVGHLRAWPEYLMFYGYIAFGLGYLYIMRLCWKHGRFLGRDVAANLR